MPDGASFSLKEPQRTLKDALLFDEDAMKITKPGLWTLIALFGCATPAPAPTPDPLTTREPAPAPTILHAEDGCMIDGVAHGAWDVFVRDGQRCGCAGGEVSCRPADDLACFMGGRWVEDGDSGPHPDGCNAARCEGGRLGRMTLLDCRVQILERVYFDDQRAEIDPRQHPLLDAIAAALRDNPAIAVVIVEGHCDPGEPEAVADQRAVAVMHALIDRGVAPDRLRPRAHGATQPISPDPEQNRRVTFDIPR